MGDSDFTTIKNVQEDTHLANPICLDTEVFGKDISQQKRAIVRKFRKQSLMFHPDRCKLGTETCTTMQQEMTHQRDTLISIVNDGHNLKLMKDAPYYKNQMPQTKCQTVLDNPGPYLTGTRPGDVVTAM